jgi:tRNA (guanine37-N1)-methyltransferase
VIRFHILTTFPEMFAGPLEESIIKRAREAGQVEVHLHNLRDWTKDRHRSTDDVQYGGGGGMVMLAGPIIEAVEDIETRFEHPENSKKILLSPQGRHFTQEDARQWSNLEDMVMICGHYKGVDERVIDHLQPEEISIGDYILTGGELPAMMLVDAITRLVPGVVGDFGSVSSDSLYEDGLLDCPRYTRPREIRELEVPEVLLSGNHAEIEKWRREQRMERTRERRPDLWQKWKAGRSAGERKL